MISAKEAGDLSIQAVTAQEKANGELFESYLKSYEDEIRDAASRGQVHVIVKPSHNEKVDIMLLKELSRLNFNVKDYHDINERDIIWGKQ